MQMKRDVNDIKEHVFKGKSNSQGGNCSVYMGSCHRNCPWLHWRCWEPALDRLREINTRISHVFHVGRRESVGKVSESHFYRKARLWRLHFLMLLEDSRNGWLKKVSAQGRSEVSIRELKVKDIIFFYYPKYF